MRVVAALLPPPIRGDLGSPVARPKTGEVPQIHICACLCLCATSEPERAERGTRYLSCLRSLFKSAAKDIKKRSLSYEAQRSVRLAPCTQLSHLTKAPPPLPPPPLCDCVQRPRTAQEKDKNPVRAEQVGSQVLRFD
jgi:hypothetical protein